ncbi:MAG: DUF2784 domain-containing protein [Vicinamibacterales bacterium]|nr:DUF2784 domain-containing protein [Vicinamibacterales bacterium]
MSALIVVVHAAFVVFVAGGALLVWRWPRVAWVHVPAVVWAAWIELSGGVCPLTPLEQAWRAREGLAPYEGDFIANWVFPWLYPEGLSREMQIGLGAGALLLNAGVYAIRFAPRRRT